MQHSPASKKVRHQIRGVNDPHREQKLKPNLTLQAHSPKAADRPRVEGAGDREPVHISACSRRPWKDETMKNEQDDDKNGGKLTPTAQEAISDAAQANVNAAVEVARSAVTSFVDVFTGERKPRKGKRGSTRKKAKSRGAASKTGKSKRSSAAKRAAAGTRSKVTRKPAARREKAKRASTRSSSAGASRRSTGKAAGSKRTGRGAQAKRSTSRSRTSKTRGGSTKRRSR